jgi:predicted dehydrogenase
MTLRIGVLAASRIAEEALIQPAALVEGVELTAIAARDLGRAKQAADRWNIPQAFGSYDELIDCDDVDAIYIGTPATLHRRWAIAAIEAHKHVLCEKPFAANADDAQLIADAASRGDVVVMEAFHWRYHPYVGQIRAVLDSGVLGEITTIDATFGIPKGEITLDDIRFDLSVGGGSTMDLGCYPIQWVRFAAGAEPEVTSATADCPVDSVDGSLRATLRWPSGVTGSVESTMLHDKAEYECWLRVVGDQGTMLANNPLAPQNGGAVITVDTASDHRTIEADTSTTYFHQLVAFRDAVVDGTPFPTTAEDGVRNMKVIDDCYRAAGLPPRPSANP